MSGVTNFVRVRFVAALIFAAAGSLLAVGAFTFAADAERWLGLGVGAGCLAVLLCVVLVPGRGLVQRILDLILLPICAWTVVSARTIELASHGASPELVRWLGFSAGAAIGGLGILSLLVHEFGVERDLTWAAEQIATMDRENTVEVHDFRDTSERDPDALPWTAG